MSICGLEENWVTYFFMQKEQNMGRFCDLGIEEKLLDILTKKGFETPTPIQQQVIPAALDGKDIVGIAQTGTGKTLAFGVPMIQRLLNKQEQGLILVPTRELAVQVEEAIRQVGSPLGLKTAVVIGGAASFPQVRALKNNPDIVIATPGRLDDLMKQGAYKLNKVSMVALDEADRMLDVGFLPQIRKILATAPKERQTMLFSATMPSSIASLSSEFMKMPLRVEVAQQGTSAENIEQELFMVSQNDKTRLLDAILEEYKTDTVLIFSRTKHGAKRIAAEIRGMGHTSTEIHSNRSQAQRKSALDGFTNKRFRVMVATDIAARGIDVKHISLVINFDLPDCSEDYVHRIGRTGRAGRSGKAISFVSQSQKSDIRKIERLIRKPLKISALPNLPVARPKLAYEPEFSGSGRSSYARKGGRGGSSYSVVSRNRGRSASYGLNPYARTDSGFNSSSNSNFRSRTGSTSTSRYSKVGSSYASTAKSSPSASYNFSSKAGSSYSKSKSGSGYGARSASSSGSRFGSRSKSSSDSSYGSKPSSGSRFKSRSTSGSGYVASSRPSSGYAKRSSGQSQSSNGNYSRRERTVR